MFIWSCVQSLLEIFIPSIQESVRMRNLSVRKRNLSSHK